MPPALRAYFALGPTRSRQIFERFLPSNCLRNILLHKKSQLLRTPIIMSTALDISSLGAESFFLKLGCSIDLDEKIKTTIHMMSICIQIVRSS
ncbi:unnamed protein product [Brugia timori]|uniref:ANK_REP_REGION domain-containing protein n=1 Tax=Brugia timori TaxID=42155 RepID=A0A0R3Q3E4_9BILA|nr:unnamed protein product [Brugia timori]